MLEKSEKFFTNTRWVPLRGQNFLRADSLGLHSTYNSEALNPKRMGTRALS